MKWRTNKKSDKVRPFLVLPLLEHERSVSAEIQLKTAMPGLRLITRNISAGTGTWPPKIKKKKSKKGELRPERPMTATLERPEVLNINLIDKIDMSLVKKEFLSITNLCKIPLETLTRNKRSSNINKRHSIKSLKCFTPSNKRFRKPEVSESSLEDEESQRSSKAEKKIPKMNKVSPKPNKSSKVNNDSNNNDNSSKHAKVQQNNTGKRSNRSVENVKSIDEVFSGPRSTRSLPEPCTTCGRPDQPERFHSHPATLVRLPKKIESPKKIVKSTVQKPIAIKYKSQIKPEEIAKKSAKMQKQTEATAENKIKSPSKGPKTVICYICGREFGTASLHLHEPKCLQKWERENSLLPRHLQRKIPVKPEKPMSTEEWNKLAWQTSQAALAACMNCGRTFLPDRLLVHQRSCKQGLQKPPFSMKTSNSSSTASPKSDRTSPASPGPPSVPCYICGRLFGTKSIGIHEPQCLKKWHFQNNQRSPSQKLPVPVKNASPASEPVSPPTPSPTQETVAAKPTSAGPKKPMLPCYICGREYGTSSIYIHEPQCLKKWKAENDKLPPTQRRKEPTKPDVVFTPTGQIDYQATNEKIWQCHLNQLVPCHNCGRTFNPDRVSVHQKSCKGQ